jgi:hypothetical protein
MRKKRRRSWPTLKSKDGGALGATWAVTFLILFSGVTILILGVLCESWVSMGKGRNPTRYPQ